MSDASWLAAVSLLEKNSMVKKHIATVHVEANLSLLERKMFNVLLINAYPKLTKQKNHAMRYTALCEMIWYSSGDRESIKKALRNIAKTQIEWIGKNEAGKEVSWKVFNYLSSAEIKWGADSFEYGFDTKLAEHLYDPEVFAQISLISQRKFTSKYALNLYENCARYRKNHKFKWITPVWEIDLFRKFMGVAETKLYSTYGELNRRIIKPSIAEINEVSDVFVTLETFKEGRKVTGLQFKVEDNPNQSQMQIPGVEDEMDLNDASENEAVKKCIELGIGEWVAIQWLKNYGEAYIQEKLILVDSQKKSGKIHSSLAGWLVRAIRDDYKDESLMLQKEKTQKRDAIRDAREIELEESEQKMQEQRQARESSRQSVAQYLSSLSSSDADQLEVDFTLETRISSSDKEAFYDWIAEQENLWNPYPAKRVARHQKTLTQNLSL